MHPATSNQVNLQVGAPQMHPATSNQVNLQVGAPQMHRKPAT
jgi:hypothetical protein